MPVAVSCIGMTPLLSVVVEASEHDWYASMNSTDTVCHKSFQKASNGFTVVQVVILASVYVNLCYEALRKNMWCL
jgi:hypothetical protein